MACRRSLCAADSCCAADSWLRAQP
jgi:hypothetical protein